MEVQVVYNLHVKQNIYSLQDPHKTKKDYPLFQIKTVRYDSFTRTKEVQTHVQRYLHINQNIYKVSKILKRIDT